MKRTTTCLLTSVLLIVAAGCGKDPVNHGPGKCAIRPSVSGVTLSKGETVTDGNLAGFKMTAVTGEYTDHTVSESEKRPAGVYFTSYVRKSGTEWKTYSSETASSSTDYYWINGNPITFWSWYPYDSGISGTLSVTNLSTAFSTLQFTYTLPAVSAGSDADRLQDLVFAGNVETRTFQDGTDNITSAQSNGAAHSNDRTFDIVFHHPLSKVQFGVDVIDGSFNKSLQITGISLENVLSSGTCSFAAPSSFSWSSQNTSRTYSQDYAADFSSCTGASGAPSGWPYSSSNGLNVCSNAFFLIPQTLSAGTSNMAVTFSLGGTTVTKRASIPAVEWKADHYYIYKIKAHGEGETLSLSVSLHDWAERENYVPID